MLAEEKTRVQQKFGETVRNLREQRNISPKEIASVLDITVQQYGNIESGKSGVDIIKVYEMANFFKTSVSVLLSSELYLTYNNTVTTNENGNVIQGNNTVNHFVEKDYLEFLKNENKYLKEKLDEAIGKLIG